MPFSVIPAKAGIQCDQAVMYILAPVLQRGDDFLRDRQNWGKEYPQARHG